MLFRSANKGIKLAYDNERLKGHTETLRKLCSELPQDKIPASIIQVAKLPSDNLAKETDRQTRIKKARQQVNLSELFLSMCETTGIMVGVFQKEGNPDAIYGILRERIYSRYRDDDDSRGK